MKTMSLIPSRFFFFFFLSFIAIAQLANSLQNPLKLHLIHQQSLDIQLNKRVATRLELLKELLLHDTSRQVMIAAKRKQSRRIQEIGNNTVVMPIHAGRDLGLGQYLTTFEVGTPAKMFTLIVDTGSDLTWMNCRRQGGSNQTMNDNRRVFNAAVSTSFKTVDCSSQMCKVDLANLFSLTQCPTDFTPCAYDYRYTDGSSSKGVFAKETVTLGLKYGGKAELHDVLVGCSDTVEGPSLHLADGVLGLAYSQHSFTSKATENSSRHFSYCLVDHLSHKNISNYLIFGSDYKIKTHVLAHKRATKLELGLISPFYAVNVIALSMDGVILKDIPAEVWSAKSGGGTIVDSGTSLTFLAEPAYKSVIAAFLPFLSKFNTTKVEGVPMEHCFFSKGFKRHLVPRLVFHFADRARFKPHRKSYVIDVADGVKCLGFVSGGTPGTNVIGNIMQQNYLWEYDLVKNKLAFAPSACL